MKQRKSKLIKWLAGVALCTALISTATGVAIADTATPISETDYQIEMIGAEIRTDDHYGIRFKATTKAVREDSKYYVMIVPEAWLTDTAHDLQNAVDGDYYAHLIGKGLSDVDDPATENVNERDFITMQTAPEKINDNLYELKGTISNVHFTNSNTKFFGIAYEEMANGTRNYAERNDKSVRSICWVAGAALNDETFDGDKTNLKPTIDRAYDYITNGAETGATLDLSKVKFKQNSYYTLDKGSVTPLEMVGLPEGLDLPIEYSVSAGSGTPSTITEDGVLTVHDETGYSFVKAQIAGETKNLTVYNTPKMADGMLNDFASGSDGNTRTYDLNYYDASVTGSRGNWQEVKEDDYGNKGYGVGSVKSLGSAAGGLRLNVSRAELKAMDFETITIRFLVECDGASTVELAFFGRQEISDPDQYLFMTYPVNTWSYYTITKPTGDAWETFLDTYCNSGTGKSGNGGFKTNTETATFYIDYVSVGTIRMESHELENFNTSAAAYNHSGDLAFGANSKGTYYKTKADGASTTACGVVYAQMWYNNGAMATRFGRTEAELLKIMENLDTLTVRLLITRSGSTEYHFKVFGVQKLIPTNTWYDFTVTRDQILATISGDTEDAKIAQFASNFCSTGKANAPRMLACACNGVVVDVYLDSITYTTTTAE